MKLSIVTVNLNNRDGLQKTIDSVVSQTFKDFEWIVIDGGSTDGSKELIEQYTDHFAYWVSEPDKGIYNAMNKGVNHAQGEYVLFLNSGDCLWNHDSLQAVFVQSPPADIIYGDYAIINGNTTQTTHYDNKFAFHTILENSICHQSTFTKRKLLLDDPYDETLKITADWKFLIRKALGGSTFHHVNTIVALYNPNGISSTQREMLIKELKKMMSAEVPECIRNDFSCYMDLKNECDQWQVKAVRYYSTKNKFFHAMITTNIHLIKLIDRLFHRDKQ